MPLNFAPRCDVTVDDVRAEGGRDVKSNIFFFFCIRPVIVRSDKTPLFKMVLTINVPKMDNRS